MTNFFKYKKERIRYGYFVTDVQSLKDKEMSSRSRISEDGLIDLRLRKFSKH